MTKEKRIDNERLQDITPVLLALEGKGMSESEVIEWINKNNPEYRIHAELYYKYKNAGRGNPLQRIIEKVDTTILK